MMTSSEKISVKNSFTIEFAIAAVIKKSSARKSIL